MLRWLLRIFLTLVVLIALGALAVQIVLWTSLPRTLVINRVQKELKLRVTCASLSTTWTGHTTLKDVTVSLPLASGSFLKLSELNIHHASLIALLLGQPVDVTDLELDQAHLVVRQDGAGRWNLQDVLELVRRAAGGNEPAAKSPEPAAHEAYSLPKITVSGASIEVINWLGQTARIEPINAHGMPQGPLVYEYDLSLGKALSATSAPATQSIVQATETVAQITGAPVYIKGKIVPGGVWQNEMGISVHDVGPWLTPLVEPTLAKKLATVAFDGKWRGGIYGPVVKGRLEIDQASALGMSARSGAIDLTMQNGTVTANPADLTIATGKPLVPTVQLTQGSVYSDGAVIRATGLIAQLTSGRVKIDGNFDFRQQTADVSLDWSGVAAGVGPLAGFVQSGHLAAGYHHTWSGQTAITSDINTTGTRASDGKQWSVAAKIDGLGNLPKRFVWTVSASRLQMGEGVAADHKTQVFDGLAASVLQATDQFTLESLAIPPGSLGDELTRGSVNAQGGGFDENTGAWNIVIHTKDWKWRKTLIAFDLTADGDKETAHIQNLVGTFGKIRLAAKGTVSAKPHATSLSIQCTYPPFDLEQYRAGIPLRGGEFASELQVKGTIRPLNLDVSGQLHGRDLSFAGRDVGNFSVHLSKAHIDSHMAELEPTTIDLFGGRWTVRGKYLYGHTLAALAEQPASQPSGAAEAPAPAEGPSLIAVVAELKGMKLAEVDNFFNPPPNVSGKLSGTWTATMRDYDLDQLEITGPFYLKEVQAKGFTAARVDGQVQVLDGQVTISPVKAQYGARPEDGTIDASAAFAIHNPSEIHVIATAVAWPIVFAGSSGKIGPATRSGAGSASAPATQPAKAPATAPATMPRELGLPMVHSGKIAPIVLASDMATVIKPRPATRAASSRPTTAASTQPTGPPLVARVWGHVDMQLHAKPFHLNGPVSGGRLLLTRGAQPLADIQASGSISDEQLIIDSLKGTAIGGTVEGSASFFLTTDEIFKSRAHIGFGGIDASRIIEMFPAVKGLAGVFGGTIDLGPTTSPRALGKSKLRATINAAGAHFGTIEIGDASLTAYFDREPPGPIGAATRASAATRPSVNLSSIRVVLDDSHFKIAGGTMQLWARYARPDDEPFINAQAQFTDLSMNQLAHAGDETPAATRPSDPSHPKANAKSYPGRLSGNVAIFGNPLQPDNLFGQGGVKLQDSDLASTNIIGALYSIMSIRFGHNDQGYGSADFRLDGGQLQITRFYYFNQGLEAQGDAAIFNFQRGLASARIKGEVIGTVHPLRDLKLPFAADADKILGVLQSNVTTLAVSGSLRDPQVKLEAFNDLSDAFKQILIGDTEHNPD